MPLTAEERRILIRCARKIKIKAVRYIRPPALHDDEERLQRTINRQRLMSGRLRLTIYHVQGEYYLH